MVRTARPARAGSDLFVPAPSRIDEVKWQEIRNDEETECVIASIREHVIRCVEDKIQSAYFEKVVTSFVSDCFRRALLQSFDLLWIKHESGDAARISTTWHADNVPQLSQNDNDPLQQEPVEAENAPATDEKLPIKPDLTVRSETSLPRKGKFVKGYKAKLPWKARNPNKKEITDREKRRDRNVNFVPVEGSIAAKKTNASKEKQITRESDAKKKSPSEEQTKSIRRTVRKFAAGDQSSNQEREKLRAPVLDRVESTKRRGKIPLRGSEKGIGWHFTSERVEIQYAILPQEQREEVIKKH